jgi:hypothetical protein
MPGTIQTASITNSTSYGIANSGNDIAICGGATPSASLSQLIASRVWNAVWNDIADFQLLNDKLEYGKCYVDHIEGARIAYERCQLGIIGMASDTFGHGVGAGANKREVPIAVCGWVLAFVDQEYPCGTPLTNDENGNLTEMTLQEKRDYPERMLGIYKKPEREEEFGPKGSAVKVNGRHWVKVK